MKKISTPDKSEVLAKARDGTLIDALFGEYGRLAIEENSPTVELLIEMHNGGLIDLITLLTPDVVKRHSGRAFFRGKYLYEQLIPKLSGAVRDVLCLVDLLREGGGDDPLVGAHVGPFAQWCSSDPKRPLELLSLIDDEFTIADSYLAIAITSGIKSSPEFFTKRAYDFLEHGNEQQRLCALQALSQIEVTTSAAWGGLLQALTAAQIVNNSDRFRGVLLFSVVKILERAPAAYVKDLELIAATAAAERGSYTLYAAAKVSNVLSLSMSLREAFLDALRFVSHEANDTIYFLDGALSKLIDEGETARVREFIEELLTRPTGGAIELAQLESTVHTVINDTNGAFEGWMVAWLRKGDYLLCRAMAETMFVGGHDEFNVAVDFSRYGLSVAEYPYLARKVVASFFQQPNIAVSLLVSLLRTVPKEVMVDVMGVLINPILVSYADPVRDYLVTVSTDKADPAAEAVRQALDYQDEYFDGLNSPGVVLELQPSQYERQLEWERRSDSMTAVMKDAQRDSLFGQLGKESVMLYGSRAVSWLAITGKDPQRFETTLETVSTLFTIPRLQCVDPIGLRLMIHTFASEKPPK